jgi:hypothetical protein
MRWLLEAWRSLLCWFGVHEPVGLDPKTRDQLLYEAPRPLRSRCSHCGALWEHWEDWC